MSRIRQERIAGLLALLDEVSSYLALPDNDYSWSSFQDASGAVSEISELSARIRADSTIPLALTVLFAPTGPIQEVALSSGWGDEFLVLADRFDALLADQDSLG